MSRMIFSNVAIFISNRLKNSSRQEVSTIGYRLGLIIITISTAFAIVSSLVMIGFHNSIENRINALLGNVKIVSQYSDQEDFDRRLLNSVYSNISGHVIYLKSVVYNPVLLQSENLLEGITLYGLDNTVGHRNIENYITNGRLPNLHQQEFKYEIAISQDLADKFNITLGAELLVCAMNNNAMYRKLIVVGIYNSHFPEFDNQFAFCDIRLAQKLNEWQSNMVNCITCFLKKSSNNTQVAKHVNTLLQSSTLYAKPIEDEYCDIFEWISVLYKNTIIFILLLLIVVNTNIASIIAMQVIDRLYMINLLKGIGVRTRQQMEIFILNNLGMVCKGVLYGNIVGIGLCALQYFTKLIKLNDSVYYIDHVPIEWRWSIIAAIDTGILFTTIAIIMVTSIVVCNKRVINSHQ